MKKILLLFLFFQVTFSYSQTYYHFPTSNTTWFETYHDQYYQNHAYTYFMSNSDTVINGKVYNNLFESNFSYDSVNIGGIREDSLKRVFFCHYSSNYEYLLYDFSKSIGDTIFYYGSHFTYPFDYCYNYLIITNIDTVLIGNKYRKRFYTGAGFSQGYEVWIEGIGSYRSLLSPIMPFVTCACSWSLDCIKENDTTYCLPQTIVSIKNNSDIPKYKIDIFPNPTSSTIEISFDKFYESINIGVYNLQGKLIDQKDYSNCKNIHFSRADLENGLYFLKIIMDKNINVTEKIILIE